MPHGGKTDTVSGFLGERVGRNTQKQAEVHLTDVCKIRFLTAGTQRLVSVKDGQQFSMTTFPHHARRQQPAPWREPAP